MFRAVFRVMCVAVLFASSFTGWADDNPVDIDERPPDEVRADAEHPGTLAVRSEIVVTAPRIEIPLDENPAATTVVGEPVLAVMPRAVAADEALKLVPGVKGDNQLNGEKVHLSIRGQGLLTERGIRGRPTRTPRSSTSTRTPVAAPWAWSPSDA